MDRNLAPKATLELSRHTASQRMARAARLRFAAGIYERVGARPAQAEARLDVATH
jgi:hypothetical protein